MAHWSRVWAGVGLAAVLALVSAGCSTPCREVALLVRQCCAKGPPELRQNCEAEAAQLERDGSSDSCQSALDDDRFKGCNQ